MVSLTFPENGVRIVDPEELGEVFVFINEVFCEAVEGNPDQYEGMNGSDSAAADKLFLRIVTELADWYHEEPQEKFTSVSWRIFSLCKLIRKGILKDWVREGSTADQMIIPRQLIQVAAILPLTHQQGFNPEAFVEAVKIISYKKQAQDLSF